MTGGVCPVDCSNTIVNEAVINKCDGKQSCIFDGSNAPCVNCAGTDPCPNMYKYTEIRYTCQKEDLNGTKSSGKF